MHRIQAVRKAVELVAGTGDRQPPAEVATHDLFGCRGHGIDALHHAPRHEYSAGYAKEHDHEERPARGRRENLSEPFALFDVAANQHAETADKYDAHQRAAIMQVVCGLVGAAIGNLGPTLPRERRVIDVGDV